MTTFVVFYLSVTAFPFAILAVHAILNLAEAARERSARARRRRTTTISLAVAPADNRPAHPLIASPTTARD